MARSQKSQMTETPQNEINENIIENWLSTLSLFFSGAFISLQWTSQESCTNTSIDDLSDYEATYLRF